jgi:hypothetical protein
LASQGRPVGSVKYSRAVVEELGDRSFERARVLREHDDCLGELRFFNGRHAGRATVAAISGRKRAGGTTNRLHDRFAVPVELAIRSTSGRSNVGASHIPAATASRAPPKMRGASRKIKGRQASQGALGSALLVGDDRDGMRANRTKCGRDPAEQQRKVVVFDIHIFLQERELAVTRRRGERDLPLRPAKVHVGPCDYLPARRLNLDGSPPVVAELEKIRRARRGAADSYKIRYHFIVHFCMTIQRKVRTAQSGRRWRRPAES